MSDLRKVVEEVLNTLRKDGQWGIDKAKRILKMTLEQPRQEPYVGTLICDKQKRI